MHAHVYKSLKKADTYVFLAASDDFACLPETLRSQLSPLQFVLQTELTPQRKLAREDVIAVRDNLAMRGYHIQLAAGDTLDPMTTDWGTDA